MKLKNLTPRSLVLVMFTLLLTVATQLSCDSQPPSFIELSTPRGSTDRLGPYQFTARLVGDVSEVNVVWVREVPSNQEDLEPPSLDRPEDQRRLTLTRDGSVWTGALEGGSPVATYRYYLEAFGAGGSAREPLSGSDSFEVQALTGRCLTDAECLTGEVCHREERYCFEQPELCAADFQCPRDQYCNLETQLCRFYDSACVSDDECAVNSRCVEGVCQATQPRDCEPACSSGSRCEEGVCVPVALECDPACVTGEVCADGVCVESSCRFDAMCPDGYACDLITQRCVQGERGSLCEPCGSASSELNEECGVGFACVPGAPGCRPVCGAAGEEEPPCHEGEFCFDGVCIADSDLVICSYYECWEGVECPSGVCHLGRCVDPQLCDEESDCASGETCIGGSCYRTESCETGNCPSGQRCEEGICTPYSSAASSCLSCSNDQDCNADEHCAVDFNTGDMTCQRICDQDEHCAEGQICWYFDSWGYCGEEDSSCGPSPDLECFPDSAEPNNSFREATPLLLSEESVQITAQFWQCAYEDDYFVLDRSANLEYEVEWFSEGPAFLYLFGPDESFLGEIPNLFPTLEPVSFQLERDIAFMQVIGVEEESYPYYFELRPIEENPSGCRDDSLEENDNLASSYRIGNGAELSLVLCPDDEDWFSARGSVGEIFTASWSQLSDPSGEVEISVGSADAFEEGNEQRVFVEGDSYDFRFTFDSSQIKHIRIRCPNCEAPVRYGLATGR